MSRVDLARSIAAVAVILLPLAAANCSAQDPPQDHTCTVDAAGIFTIPQGSDGENFEKLGWGVQAGGGFEVTPRPAMGSGWQWFVTGNYLYDQFKANAKALASAVATNPQLMGATAAHSEFSSVTLDVSPRLERDYRDSFYAVGGFGWLHRGISFNGANPGTLLLSNSPSLDRVSSNSGVFDLGVGYNYGPPAFRGLMLFGKARVYKGLAINDGSILVPISVGVRW